MKKPYLAAMIIFTVLYFLFIYTEMKSCREKGGTYILQAYICLPIKELR
jgi:hypothetical protein